MATLRKQSEKIRQFILANVVRHPNDIANFTAKEFAISRQAINKHIHALVEQNLLLVQGSTRNKAYSLRPLEEFKFAYDLTKSLEEDAVWRNDISPKLGQLPDNVINIWNYGFTEMLNNAIEHSSGSKITIWVQKTAADIVIVIYDNGEGIFKKIQREMELGDERHAVLELSKGKLTTDPKNHTGEGIFFSSRMFDHFAIISGNVAFSHTHDRREDWIWEHQESSTGTGVYMKLNSHTPRTTKQIFDKFTSDDEEYGFTKTVVPVRLAQYGNENLVSRSQAKRLLSRVERFKVVIFDFEGVEEIGQAFADEIFRVFASQHPHLELLHTNANKTVSQMISRAKSNL
ncbi:MAG: DUF4325 domain-containing protein [Methylovulum miyakonense]|uniref:STAS-like domain-containing protein n=1 Tax=Methylovulum miyakonense TaxID=645578 RepID=UPI003BB5934C